MNNPPTTTFLPDNSYIQAHLQGKLSKPFSSDKATNTKFFDNLNHSLISLGQLCDSGCTIVLTKNDLIISKNNKQILKGICNETGDGLWDTRCPQDKVTCYDREKIQTTPNNNSINVKILRAGKHANELTAYLNAI